MEERTIEVRASHSVDRMIFRGPAVKALRLPLLIIPKANTPWSSTIFLAYGFAGLIIIGAILLMLPISNNSGSFTSVITAFFTATSAVSLAGLAVVDTGTYWSAFGQYVIFALIQIGGVGFIVGATLLILAINGRFGLKDRLLISESLGVDQLSGVLSLVLRVALFALILEAAGAAIFYFRWASTGDPGGSLWNAIFLAASAFNNCGMDLFGGFKSLAAYQEDWVTLLTTAVLILFGSTGYIVIANLCRGFSLKKLSLDSKIVIFISVFLLIGGTLFYFIAEYTNPATMAQYPLPHKIMVSFFQAVVPRTAGFSVVDTGSLRQISVLFTVLLMFIGGTTGSTAGGVKVNTIGVLAIAVYNILRGRENINAFGRQITRPTVYRAMTLFMTYLGMAFLIVILLSITEAFPLEDILFESFSALGTVGLSMGITPSLSMAGKWIIIATMFIGRLGPLAIMAYIVRHQKSEDIDYPHESVRLG